MRTRLSTLLAASSVILSAPLTAQAPTVASPTDWSVLNRPRTHKPVPTSGAITKVDLETRLYIFSDDSMQGRNLGTAGNAKGVEYIARDAARIGLTPMGDGGTFFQTVGVVDRAFDSTSRFVAGTTTLAPWTEFVVRDAGPSARSIEGAQVVYGGSITDPASLIDSATAVGKFVVLDESGVTGFRPTPAIAAALRRMSGAAGIGGIALDNLPPQYLAFFRRPNQMVVGEVEPATPAILMLSRAGASKLLGRSIDSVKSGMLGLSITSAPRILQTSLKYPARNVVAMLPGSDPKLRAEYVAIGAHNDHLGFNTRPVAHDSIFVLNHLFRTQGQDDRAPVLNDEQNAQINSMLARIRKGNGGASARLDSIYNGADDDGSGSVGVLEIAEYFAAKKVKPKRSLLFVWHVGEEEGLYGSEWVTDHPPVPRDSIVTQLNIDMIGRGDSSDITGESKEGVRLRGSSDYVQLIGSRRLSTELGDLVEAVDKTEKHPLAIDYSNDANGHPQRIYCRSDHYSYARYGIPIAFFTTGGHADYHQVTDEPQYIDYDRFARVTQFVADIAESVANLSHAPVVDKAKPDPHGRCVQ